MEVAMPTGDILRSSLHENQDWLWMARVMELATTAMVFTQWTFARLFGRMLSGMYHLLMRRRNDGWTALRCLGNCLDSAFYQ